MTTAATSTSLAFPNRKPRAQCPCCGRSVATTPVDGSAGRLRDHKLLGFRCDGSGRVAALNGRAVVAR